MSVSIWLGSRASIWQHRGYTVKGERVLCESHEDAVTVLHQSFADADSLVEVDSDDGTYYYGNQFAADADSSGVNALAVIRG